MNHLYKTFRLTDAGNLHRESSLAEAAWRISWRIANFTARTVHCFLDDTRIFN